MIDVVAIGEMLIDFTCQSVDDFGYPTMAAHPGGAPANYLAALSKYGVKTAMLSKVGDDTFGKLLLCTLRSAGIDTRGVAVDKNTFTTLAFVTLSQNGDREFSFARKPGADTCLSFEEIALGLIDEAKVFHFGTLSLTNEPARTATQKTIEYAKRKEKLISFDPNLRRPLWPDIQEAKKQMLWGLSQADIVKISEEETEFLFGCDVHSAADKIISEFGVKLVFVTLGKEGCLYKNALAVGTVKPPNYDFHTVDTTGAGDIFGGTAVSRILRMGISPEKLSNSELFEIASFACAAASLSTESYGGIPSVPDEETVLELLSGHKG